MYRKGGNIDTARETKAKNDASEHWRKAHTAEGEGVQDGGYHGQET